MDQKTIPVIVNPAAGRGRALARLQRLLHALGMEPDVRPTLGPGHGEELALEAARSGFAAVGAAGGDGTVHEVGNGLLKSRLPDVSMAIFPVGSANDYAHSIALESAWEKPLAGQVGARAVDVGLARTEDGRERFFVNGIGLGFNGAVNQEARRIHRLQGLALYGCAMLRSLWSHFDSPMMTVTIDGVKRQVPTLALSVAIGRREGNFLLAPDALLDDGQFDYLHAGALSRWELLRRVPGMIAGTLPKDHPALQVGRCRHVALRSEAPILSHVDGEIFSRPEDRLHAIDVHIIPRALRVTSYQPLA